MTEVLGLNLKAWETWLGYRKAIRKPLKEVSIEAAQKKLASFGDRQMEAVQNSIANGWTGLFAPAKERVALKVQQNQQRDEFELERLKARALRIEFRAPMPNEDVIGYKTLVTRAEHDHAMARPVSREPTPIAKLLAGVAK